MGYFACKIRGVQCASQQSEFRGPMRRRRGTAVWQICRTGTNEMLARVCDAQVSMTLRRYRLSEYLPATESFRKGTGPFGRFVRV
jgi:hypothetical protein